MLDPRLQAPLVNVLFLEPLLAQDLQGMIQYSQGTMPNPGMKPLSGMHPLMNHPDTQPLLLQTGPASTVVPWGILQWIAAVLLRHLAPPAPLFLLQRPLLSKDEGGLF